jgi:hypothetical protein
VETGRRGGTEGRSCSSDERGEALQQRQPSSASAPGSATVCISEAVTEAASATEPQRTMRSVQLARGRKDGDAGADDGWRHPAYDRLLLLVTVIHGALRQR